MEEKRQMFLKSAKNGQILLSKHGHLLFYKEA